MRGLLLSSLICVFCLSFCRARLDPVTILPLNRDSMNKLSRSEFVFGKDRELFHASVDLKWVVGIISNKNTWVTLLSSVFERFKRLHGEYDTLIKYREIASNILLKLRSHNKDTDLRLYQNSLISGQSFAVTKRRLIVFYVDENTQNPSVEALEYRNALADPTLGDYINDNFIFMASIEEHPYANQVLQMVSDYEDNDSMLTNLDNLNDMSSFGRYRNQDRIAFRNGKFATAPVPLFPKLVVLAPVPPVPRGKYSLSRWFARSGQLSVVGVAALRRGSINATSLTQFLRTAAKNHGSNNNKAYEIASPENALFEYGDSPEPLV